ncbi:hypothetical protein AVEN_159315-1, partial [Araneus ventricosus]
MARVSVAAETVREIPGFIEMVCRTLAKSCQACIDIVDDTSQPLLKIL